MSRAARSGSLGWLAGLASGTGTGPGARPALVGAGMGRDFRAREAYL